MRIVGRRRFLDTANQRLSTPLARKAAAGAYAPPFSFHRQTTEPAAALSPAGYQKAIPPLRSNTCPTDEPASDDARKATIPATSSGVW